jgi:hypothetical protein
VDTTDVAVKSSLSIGSAVKSLLFCVTALSGCLGFAEKGLNKFVSSSDFLEGRTASNIFLQNTQASSKTVYGLYVRQLAMVSSTASTCSGATTLYSGGGNLAAGAVIMPVEVSAGKKAEVGPNFLYNMIYQGLYHAQNVIPSEYPACMLPGCTWGSDPSPGKKWCIYMGALSPSATNESDYTSSLPPHTESTSSSGHYNYDLIGSGGYSYLGPISCSDQTLSCSVADAQTQSF